jgi:hypothetical protein
MDGWRLSLARPCLCRNSRLVVLPVLAASRLYSYR